MKLFACLPLVLMGTFVSCVAPGEGSSPRLPTDAEVEQYNASVPPAERIVCRNETPVGSNIVRRVCRNARNLQESSAAQRDELRRILQ